MKLDRTITDLPVGTKVYMAASAEAGTLVPGVIVAENGIKKVEYKRTSSSKPNRVIAYNWAITTKKEALRTIILNDILHAKKHLTMLLDLEKEEGRNDGMR